MEILTDDASLPKFKKQYIPGKFEITSNNAKNVNKNHLQILKSTYEKFLQIPNADFKIFMAKSLQNTNSQTLVYFLLSLLSSCKNPSEFKIFEFLSQTDLESFFKSYRKEDFDLFIKLLVEVSKTQGGGTRSFLHQIAMLQNRQINLSWLSDSHLFGQLYHQACSVASIQEAKELVEHVNLACSILESSFSSSEEPSVDEESSTGIATINKL